MVRSSKGRDGSHEVVVLGRIRRTLRLRLNQLRQHVTRIIVWIKSTPSRFKTWRTRDKTAIRYRSFKLQKRIKPDLPNLPSSWQFVQQSFNFLWKHKKLFLGLLLVHVIVYYTVVRAPIQPDVENIQKNISSVVEGSELQISSVESNVVTLSAVLGSTGSTQQNGTLAIVVIFLISMAYVWALRQIHNGNKISIRDALYQGMTSIVPVAMIVIVILLGLLPFAFASFVYTLARSTGIFVTGFEDIAFFSLTMLIGLLSFYWMTSAVIALYMSALPGIYPMYALHSAKKLVQYRRLQVFRRMIALPVMLGVSYLLFILLSIKFVPSKTFIIAEIIQLIFVPIVHVYLYKIYRSML